MWYFKGWLYDIVISIRQKLKTSAKCREILNDLKTECGDIQFEQSFGFIILEK